MVLSSSVVSDKSRKDDNVKTKPDIYGETTVFNQHGSLVANQRPEFLLLCVHTAVSKPGDGEEFEDSPAPCPDTYEQFCEHGQCEMRDNLPTCR